MSRKAKSKRSKKARTYQPRRRVVSETTPAADATPLPDGEAACEQDGAASEPTTGEAQSAEPKPRKKAAREDGTMSGLDAAAKVLTDAGKPLDCQAIVERAGAQGRWKPGGKTPHATLYSAIIREIAKKGDQARFRKTERGHFTVAA